MLQAIIVEAAVLDSCVTLRKLHRQVTCAADGAWEVSDYKASAIYCLEMQSLLHIDF